MTGSPTVTVVVPTRNNTRTIDVCLTSVTTQTYPEVELIVVDNHSTDDTRDIAARHTTQVFTGGPERSAQRNLGIDHASGEWVLWLDSDMVLPPDAIEVAVRTARQTGATGVALPERTIGNGFWTACRALERECYLNQPWLHNPRLVRRDYLLGDGGFNLSMSGPEDADLRMRMRGDGSRIEPGTGGRRSRRGPPHPRGRAPQALLLRPVHPCVCRPSPGRGRCAGQGTHQGVCRQPGPARA